MSIRKKLTGTVLSLGLLGTLGIAAHAQQLTPADKATSQSDVKAKGTRKGGRHHRGLPVLRFMRELNLTDAQKEQARVVVDRFRTSIEPQRQALKELHKQREQGTVSDDVRTKAQALRGEIRESAKGVHAELLTILTPEQNAQYEKLKSELKARRESRRARHSAGEVPATAQ